MDNDDLTPRLETAGLCRIRGRYLRLPDPLARTMETFRLTSGNWLLAGVHSGDDKVRAEPFQEVEIELAGLWASE